MKKTILSAGSNRPGAKGCTKWDPKMRAALAGKLKNHVSHRHEKMLSFKDTALKYPPPTQGGLKLDISQKYTIGNFPVGAVIFNSIKTGKLGR